MKVLLLNGSPNEKGCTYTALNEISDTLIKNNIKTEIFHAGAILKKIDGKEFVDTVLVKEALSKLEESDGLIVGSPVHYADISAVAKLFLDKFFGMGKNIVSYKPAAAVVSARRSGTTATLAQIHRYFMLNNMPVISSQYWNMVHGSIASDVADDLEGLQTMRGIGENMTWILKCLEAGKSLGITAPTPEEPRQRTNFIR
jgi:Multimeric flavodoxin WrbA